MRVPLLALWLATASATGAAAMKIQGSTTFAAEVLKDNLPAIEARYGSRLDVIANKSIWGLFALFEGRADVAMISARLGPEIAAARKLKPGLDYDRLVEHQVTETRIAFPVHTQNSVSHLDPDTVKRLLTGDIKSWAEVGGPDIPVMVVAVREGGGTVAAVKDGLLGGRDLSPAAVRLESARHVLKVVEQEPGAIGIAQLSLVRAAGLNEIVMGESVIAQPLSLVTLGPPAEEHKRLFSAVRAALPAIAD